jgi:hypothetical protein
MVSNSARAAANTEPLSADVLVSVIFPEALSLPAEPLLGVLDEKLGLSMPGDSVVFTAQRVCIRVEFTVLPAYMPPR